MVLMPHTGRSMPAPDAAASVAEDVLVDAIRVSLSSPKVLIGMFPCQDAIRVALSDRG